MKIPVSKPSPHDSEDLWNLGIVAGWLGNSQICEGGNLLVSTLKFKLTQKLDLVKYPEVLRVDSYGMWLIGTSLLWHRASFWVPKILSSSIRKTHLNFDSASIGFHWLDVICMGISLCMWFCIIRIPPVGFSNVQKLIPLTAVRLPPDGRTGNSRPSHSL